MSTRAEKDARARFGMCWDKALHHVRVGAGSRDGTTITLIGFASDLHGTVCACCPRRDGGVAPGEPPLGAITPEEWATFTTALRQVVVGGKVHQSDMRPLIRGRIKPQHIGACYGRAIAVGLIREVDREQSDDTAGRNTNKWEPVYALRGVA